MKPPTLELAESIDRLARNSNDWERVVAWIRESSSESVARMLQAEIAALPGAQGEARVLADMLEIIDAAPGTMRMAAEIAAQNAQFSGNTASGGSRRSEHP